MQTTERSGVAVSAGDVLRYTNEVTPIYSHASLFAASPLVSALSI